MSSPEADQRRLAKYLARSTKTLDTDAVALMGDEALQLTLTHTVEKSTGKVTTELSIPTVSEAELWACIARCRLFFLPSEDGYLPKVVAAIYNLAPKGKRPKLKQLVDLVNSQIVDGNLVGALMYSGRLEEDNGLGPGQLLGSDQVTMDYIYGVVMHEDEERRARLNNVRHVESVEHAVLMQLANLLRLVRLVRDQILLGQANGWLPEVNDSLTLESGLGQPQAEISQGDSASDDHADDDRDDADHQTPDTND